MIYINRVTVKTLREEIPSFSKSRNRVAKIILLAELYSEGVVTIDDFAAY